MKLHSIAIGAVLVAVVAAAPAGALPQQAQNTIVVETANLEFGATIDGCFPGAGINFNLESPAGAHLGNGTGCITNFVTQCPAGPVRGCHETVYSTLTFNLDGSGTITAPSTFEAVDVSPTDQTFHSTGDITIGTGEFAGATGTVTGQGIIHYLNQDATNATFVVRVS
jgi:hypothetical protein